MEHVKIGSRVKVKRINGEERIGYVLEEVECLRHIGRFYNVGDVIETTTEKTGKRRIKRKTFGMYSPEDMKVLAGRPRKEAQYAEVCE